MIALRTRSARTRLNPLWPISRRAARLAHRHFQASPPAPQQVVELPPCDGLPVRARLYRPHAGCPAPALIYLHGGGYTHCDIDTHDDLCRWLSHLAQAAVISVDYRLAPEHRFPSQLQDAEAAALWVVDHASDLGLDPNHLAFGGDSAGGFLAAHTAARLASLRPGAIRLQLLLYPLMHVDASACAAEARRFVRLVGRTAAVTIGGHVLSPGAAAVQLSQDQIAAAPPTIIVSGDLDPIRAEARAYADDLRARGKPVTDLRYPRLLHAGFSFPGLFPVNLRGLSEVGRTLGGALRAGD